MLTCGEIISVRPTSGANGFGRVATRAFGRSRRRTVSLRCTRGPGHRAVQAEKAVRSMAFLGGSDSLELFLSRCQVMSVASVPACLSVMVFLVKEEGWHHSLLLCFLMPLIAAYLGVRGKREIRAGMAATGLVLAVATLPLAFALSSLEGA